ncbi:MAG: helix-turn-helix domain-containing protein [Bacteroides sp.]|nr:helix-turn-helix domain-containing protein [Bacteroides sp.]
MTPQATTLLQGLLEAKDYKLSIEEIMQLLWSNNIVPLERIHSAVKRLRDYLSMVSDWTIENADFSYQLKKPHSIEENLV